MNKTELIPSSSHQRIALIVKGVHVIIIIIFLRTRMALMLPVDLIAAGLHCITDVSEDWCRVSLQVLRIP
jgi:hypothetical protein